MLIISQMMIETKNKIILLLIMLGNMCITNAQVNLNSIIEFGKLRHVTILSETINLIKQEVKDSRLVVYKDSNLLIPVNSFEVDTLTKIFKDEFPNDEYPYIYYSIGDATLIEVTQDGYLKFSEYLDDYCFCKAKKTWLPIFYLNPKVLKESKLPIFRLFHKFFYDYGYKVNGLKSSRQLMSYFYWDVYNSFLDGIVKNNIATFEYKDGIHPWADLFIPSDSIFKAKKINIDSFVLLKAFDLDRFEEQFKIYEMVQVLQMRRPTKSYNVSKLYFGFTYTKAGMMNESISTPRSPTLIKYGELKKAIGTQKFELLEALIERVTYFQNVSLDRW